MSDTPREYIDKQKLQEIEEALSKATPGPWHYYSEESFVARADSDLEDEEDIVCEGVTSGHNAHLIAESPEYIAYLLGALHSAQEEITALREAKQYEINAHEKSCLEYQEEIAKLTERLKLTVADSESLLARAIQAEQELDRQRRLMDNELQIKVRLREERNALLEGLKWYADPEQYYYSTENCPEVLAEGGERARDIIAKYEQPKPDTAPTTLGDSVESE